MDSRFPIISVITPSFNQGHFLEETILSILGQNYPSLEYIIIDGGSSDDSVDIIKKYEKQLSYWVIEKDKGQSHAINKGFKQATGEILMWLNSDDVLMPNILFFIAKMIVSNKDGIYFGNCLHFKYKSTGVESYGSDVITASNNYPLEYVDYIIQPSSFWTRNVYNDVGTFNETLHFGFDWEWFLRAKKKGIKMIPFNKCISMYRIHADHKSGIGGKKRQDELLTIYEMYNPRGAILFKLLMNKDKDWSMWAIYQIKFMKKLYFFFNKPLSEGRVLKMINPSKYRQFTEQEISYMRYML